MNRIAVVADSNSGITQAEGEELGIYVLPMPFYINDQMHLEDIDLSQKQFYEMLAQNAEISTSQPSVTSILDLWNWLLETHDEIVYIPMSSGLSGSCETALSLARDYDGKVEVVNNQRISVTQRQSALDALTLAARGCSAAQIRETLEQVRFDSSIYIMVDTLEYLKKGGRVTPAAAAIGSLLRLRPVLQIQGEKLDAFAKARSVKQAKKIMIEAIAHDFRERFDAGETGERMHIMVAHTQNQAEAESFREELLEHFPNHDIIIRPLTLSISCHIGPGSLAVACSKYLPGEEVGEMI